ncbi:MAG: hypothetical protein HYS13_13905 [Planctomycetia bacterium]|nr:hypothetical protein [Planctomycetia bacterium]
MNVTAPHANPQNEGPGVDSRRGAVFQFQIWHLLVLTLAAGLFFWITREAGLLISAGPLALLVLAVGVRVSVRLALAFQDRAAREQNPGTYSPFDQRRQGRSALVMGMVVAFVSALVLTAVIIVIVAAANQATR